MATHLAGAQTAQLSAVLCHHPPHAAHAGAPAAQATHVHQQQHTPGGYGSTHSDPGLYSHGKSASVFYRVMQGHVQRG